MGGRLGGRPETAAYREHSHSIASRAWQQEGYMVFESRQYSQSRRSRMGTVPPNSIHEHHIASCREAPRWAFACYVAQCQSDRNVTLSPGSERSLKPRPCEDEAEKEGSSSQPGQAKPKPTSATKTRQSQAGGSEDQRQPLTRYTYKSFVLQHRPIPHRHVEHNRSTDAEKLYLESLTTAHLLLKIAGNERA